MNSNYEDFEKGLLLDVRLSETGKNRANYLIEGDAKPAMKILTEAGVPFVYCDGASLHEDYHIGASDPSDLCGNLLLELLEKVDGDYKKTKKVIIVDGVDRITDQRLLDSLTKFFATSLMRVDHDGKSRYFDLLNLTLIFAGHFKDKEPMPFINLIGPYCVKYQISSDDVEKTPGAK